MVNERPFSTFVPDLVFHSHRCSSFAGQESYPTRCEPETAPTKPAIGSAFVAGFVGAAGKAIRDHFNDGDKGAPVEKLPV